MPNRPQQHQLEDYSIIQFKQLLPNSWIIREKGKDYGIDLEIEIVDANGNLSGEVFFVQMKATNSDKLSIIQSVSMKLGTLNYYKKILLPVMLVRYSKALNQFYFKWVNNVDLYYSKKNAKTINIFFNEQNIWNSTSAAKIKSHLIKFRIIKRGLVQLPIKLTLKINQNLLKSENQVVTESKVEVELSRYKQLVNIVVDLDDPLFSANIQENEININASELYFCTFHNPFSDNQTLSKIIADHLLIGISLILIRIGQFESASKIIMEAKLLPLVLKHNLGFPETLIVLLKSSYMEQVFQTIDDLAPNEDSLLLNVLYSLSLLLLQRDGSNKIITIIERILKKQLENAIKNENKVSIAIANYNLANHYKDQKRYLESLNYYQRARKVDDTYLNQSYFFGELGGILFLQERFSISSKLYKRSIELDRKQQVLPLYADSLMFSGKYQDALIIYHEYLQNNNKPRDEFILKAFILETKFNLITAPTQDRQIINALKIVGNASTLNLNDSLQEALKLDMLCGLAWFNLGIIYSNNNQFKDASIAFLSCALFQTWDLSAWTNAIISMILSPKSDVLLTPTVRAAYFCHREILIQTLFESFNVMNLNIEKLRELKDYILNITKNIREEQKPIEVRMPNSKGIFKDILSEIEKGENS